ncbi:hypothetical protein [Falsiphaeobacter marinintestinus]|uniref:hypothetical protein n=1 Tax=Falsiphaeobacter marinintestinus TaxID=1492905 RepID=UPI0011B3A3F1|nr:hypothetical protein [Phaeobacter marinintestinus]
MAHPHCMPRVALAIAAIATLAGCAMDSEAKVRTQLGAWVNLGETVYFESRMDCTAALFKTRSTTARASVSMVRTLPDGLRLISAGETVGFDLPAQSPNAISQQVMSADLPNGLGLVSSGISGKNCMSDTVQRAYLTALTSDNSIMIYAPSTNALAVLDVQQGQVFFARGDV